MHSNITLKLMLLLLITSCNFNTQKETTNSLTVSGNKEILKNLKIELISVTQNKNNINNDTLLVFKESIKSNSINTKALRYTYLINYKDSLFTSRSFDNPIKAIGREKAKHHWSFLLKNNELYANFSNHLIDTINDSSIKLLRKK